MGREQEREVSRVLGRRVARLGVPVAVAHRLVDRLIEQRGEVVRWPSSCARARKQDRLDLAARGEDGAPGHPGLPRGRRRSRGADRRVGWIELDALDAELRPDDLHADGHEPLAHLGGRRVHARERTALVAHEANAGGREVVEPVRVADVLHADREADTAAHALAVREVPRAAGQRDGIGLGPPRREWSVGAAPHDLGDRGAALDGL